ncbi:MAG: tRNA uridine-5-carboxymethylaminomethyl(34) synthesis GTPase MnmE [Bacteroidales bacterium]|nr:tRNA uridine-5-carboxymethylaminomethyl(34) synthesis GTPase MnmE [Bacteroidales bacterium]
MADTIAAIATAPGRGGIGVIRISGANISDILRQICGESELLPRQATLLNFLGENRETIDQGIALYFPAPFSFTGENVLELQGHGGNVVLHRLLERCIHLGARLANPGEFTQRAFLNDKIDLAQAESIADLIDASSEQAAISALRSLNGEFSKAINQVITELIELRMLVEATLDFPEEELDILDNGDVLVKFDTIESHLSQVFDSARQGSILREGMHVVLVGQPNVGKSSLLNCLAGEEIAIVTEIAGTTRDAIRQNIQIEGVAVHIIDTAGLRKTNDLIEEIGISRTWEAIRQANVALILIDATQGLTTEDSEIIEQLPSGLPMLRIFNKIDLLKQAPRVDQHDGIADIYLSAKERTGVEILRQQLLSKIGWHQTGEGVFLARERHLVALRNAHTSLSRARSSLMSLEIAAEELRQCQESLSCITGEFTSDDLLGEIFSRFCIGK